MTHMYNGILLSHKKGRGNWVICRDMDGSQDCHTNSSEVRQRRRKSVWHPFYAGSKKKWYKWTYLQKRNRLTDLEDEFMVARGEGWGEGIVSKFGTDRYTRLYLKWITNKVLLYSRGNAAQCYVEAWMGGEFGGEQIHVYVWLSPFAVHLKLAQHC